MEAAGPAGPGRFWVRVDGRLLEASLSLPLPRGSFRARVVRPGPPLILSPLDGGKDPVPSSFATRPYRWALLVQTLCGLLEAQPERDLPEAQALGRLLRFPQDPEALSAALARWVRAAWPRDPKGPREVPGELWRLAAQLLEGEPNGRLKEALEAVRQHLPLLQARIRDPLVIPLALPWGGTWMPGELVVEAESRESGRPGLRIRGIVVRLELPRLGPVEVSVRWGGEALWVRIAAGRNACGPLRARLGELRTALRVRAGVPLRALHVAGLPSSRIMDGERILEVKA